MSEQWRVTTDAVPDAEWTWFGSPGHLIVSEDCRFHLCTQVGPWLVSTVGEYLPDEAVREAHARTHGVELEGKGDARRRDFLMKVGYLEIGHGRTYETMVFRAGEPCTAEMCGGCGMPELADALELDSRGYTTARDATAGHMEMCAKWARRESA